MEATPFEPVVVVHRDGPLGGFLTDAGIPFEILPLDRLTGEESGAFTSILVTIKNLAPMQGFLRTEGIDLVHCNDARMNLSWGMPAAMARLPFVWHQRSLFPGHRQLRMAVRRASRVVAISDFVRASLPAGVPSIVIPNPFDTSEPTSRRPELLAELDLPPECKVIGWFGRIVAFKRPEALVDLLTDLGGALPGAVVCFFGLDKEGLRPQLESRAREGGVEDRIHFMGMRSDPGAWMKSCDVVVAPTVDEGSGRVVVEAMLAGTPVVAADSGGHKELIVHGVTGFLVTPGDRPALATIVADVLGSDTRELTAKARGSAERFSIEAHVEKVTALYRGLLV